MSNGETGDTPPPETPPKFITDRIPPALENRIKTSNIWVSEKNAFAPARQPSRTKTANGSDGRLYLAESESSRSRAPTRPNDRRRDSRSAKSKSWGSTMSGRSGPTGMRPPAMRGRKRGGGGFDRPEIAIGGIVFIEAARYVAMSTDLPNQRAGNRMEVKITTRTETAGNDGYLAGLGDILDSRRLERWERKSDGRRKPIKSYKT